MGQLYTPLTIGTAKPAWQTAEVPHYLFDMVAMPIDFSAAQYAQAVHSIVRDCWMQKKIPIIVGGSGFYLSSLIFPVQEYEKKDNWSEDPARATQDLWSDLLQVDESRARAIHPSDRYRIVRALELYYTTGTLPSHAAPRCNPFAPITIVVGLTRDREDLEQRIAQRAQEMLDAGLRQEAEELSPEWKKFCAEKKIIGYQEILETPIDAEALKNIVVRSRQYAKRQMTWWRGFLKKIQEKCPVERVVVREYSLTFSPPDLYLHEVLSLISARYE